MTEMLSPGATIGILGGGQLGRMLSVAASRLGFRTHVYEPSANPPAGHVADRVTTAAYDDLTALRAIEALLDACVADGLRAFLPSRSMCTDNAAMVAAEQRHNRGTIRGDGEHRRFRMFVGEQRGQETNKRARSHHSNDRSAGGKQRLDMVLGRCKA